MCIRRFFQCYFRSVFLSLGSVSCVSQYKIQKPKIEWVTENCHFDLVVFNHLSIHLLFAGTLNAVAFRLFMVCRSKIVFQLIQRACAYVCVFVLGTHRETEARYVCFSSSSDLSLNPFGSIVTEFINKLHLKLTCPWCMYVQALYNHRISPRISIQIESQLETHVPLIFVLYFLSRQNSTQ